MFFLNAIKLKKCLIKPLILILLQLNVSECYKTQEMRYKVVHRCFFVVDSIPDQYTTQEKCHMFLYILL